MKRIITIITLLFSLSTNVEAQERRFYSLNIHSKANPDLYIKYMADLGENGVYFLYEYKNDDVNPHQISLSENYRLVDERTGKTYYPTEKTLEGYVNVFPKTTHTFFVKFPSLPRLNYVSFYENDCLKTNDFCLTNLSLA